MQQEYEALKRHILRNGFWSDSKPSIISQPDSIVVFGEDTIALCPVAVTQVSADSA